MAPTTQPLPSLDHDGPAPPASVVEAPDPSPSGGPAPHRIALTAQAPARIRRRRVMATTSLVLADIVALTLASVAAYFIRQSFVSLGRAPDLGGAISDSAVVIAAGWLLAIMASGGYNPRLISAGPELYRSVMRASLIAAGLVGAGLYLTGVPLSRPFFVALFLVGPLLLLLVRLLARRLLQRARTAGKFRSRVLAVGSPSAVRGISRTLRREAWLGYDVAGAVLPISEHYDRGPQDIDGIQVMGREDSLRSVVRLMRPDIVLFTAGSTATAEEFRRTAWDLEDLNVDVIVVPGLSEIAGDRVRMRPVAGLPLVHLDLPRSRKALTWTKRAFDIAASSLALLLLSPVLLGIMIAIKRDDGGTPIFRQQRVGRGGRPFTFLKFRSMVTDAESRRDELETLARDRGNAVMFKMADDPRVTKVGKVLRRYSLDELPQLINVLRGDMSLVGPRPALPQEVSDYDIDAKRRLAVSPGITGLWQVSGRSNLSWDDTVRLDLYYVDNWSFTRDLLILARTVRAVLASRGAY